MASSRLPISLDAVQHTVYIMLAFTSILIFARIAAQIVLRKRPEASDYLLGASVILYLVLCTLYLTMLPRLYKIAEVLSGIQPPWPTFEREMVAMFGSLFVNTWVFWTSLWCIKLSLLVLYRKLMVGLAPTYMRMWWRALIFCILVSGPLRYPPSMRMVKC